MSINYVILSSLLIIKVIEDYNFPVVFYNNFLVVEKAGQNMQHTMIASYIAILLGYITMDDKVICETFDHCSEITEYLY